jgi:hypothetical protein
MEISLVCAPEGWKIGDQFSRENALRSKVSTENRLSEWEMILREISSCQMFAS